MPEQKLLLTYDLIDDGENPLNQESNFGLYDYQFNPKPSAAAFRTLAGLMSDCSTYEFTADLAQNTIIATFTSGSTVSYVVWTYAPGYSRDFCFPVPDGRPIALKDLTGTSLPLERCDDTSQVKLHISEAAGPMILHGQTSSLK